MNEKTSPFDTDVAPPSDLTGQRMGDLQVLARLGRGGMADVYKGMQLSLERKVAIKVLRQDLAKDSSYVERFRREAKSVARLTHPNIVQVYEVGQWRGLHYICQEFVDGLNLKEQIDRHGPIDAEMTADVLFSVAAALERASGVGITHRDIKPENLMLARSGEIKVADFGLARVASSDFQSSLTQAGLTMGTPLYMSPEQVQGGEVDVRSDLYSLGVTVYHLFTGKPPFDGETPLSIAVQHVNGRPPNLAKQRSATTGATDTPPWLSAIIARLMAKSAADRFQSPSELIEALHEASGRTLTTAGIPKTLPPSSPSGKLQQVMASEPRDWSHTLIGVASLGLVFLAIAVGVVLGRRSVSESVNDQIAALQTVSPQETVAEQFFLAQQLQTPEAWQSVWEIFPASQSETNRVYEWKARLQRGRYHLELGEYAEAIRVVEEVFDATEAPANYRAIAAGIAFAAATRAENPTQAKRWGDELRSQWNRLGSDYLEETVVETVPPEARRQLDAFRDTATRS